jgi:GNAT superfamily N-acetyltransferase
VSSTAASDLISAVDITVTPVVSREERNAFIKFPWKIYRHDPAWVPPLIIERKEFLDRSKHPFYEHGDAALFLAWRNGEVVGRIMASDDPRYNATHHGNTGCFGLFDCIDDVAVARSLFDAAAAWLVGKGRSEVIGPIDYSTNYVCGLLIEGFEHAPTLLMAHNPPYYARLIEGCGFHKEKDWYAWWFAEFPEAAQRLRKIAAARAKKHGVTIRPIVKSKLAEESNRIISVYNQAWEKNWGYVPFTQVEAEHMARELKPILVPEGALLAEVEGKPIGFVLGVPDINVALRHLKNGRLTTLGLPIGLLKLLYYQRKIRTGRLVALGVIEKYRRAGIAEMLVLQVIDEAFSKRGYRGGELSMTLEDNVMVNRFIEAVGAKRYKTYRIYRREIGSRTA